ncbi:hypothetical protein FRA_34c06230 [Francisella sp. W12-1067]|nr:hypothetical protein FRA_34c06230 [Francisella sp. W12-1067]
MLELVLHPVEQAAKLHSEFVKIYPFIDVDGRTSRLLRFCIYKSTLL